MSSTAKGAGHGAPVGQKSLKWNHVCSMLENTSKVKRKERKDMIERMFEKHRQFDPDVAAGRSNVPSAAHMYSLVRLLLPQLDRNEQGDNVLYHMKEAGISKIFGNALGMGGPSQEKLKNWKKPAGGEGYGHFAVVLYHQLVSSGAAHHSGMQVTVADVNEFLNAMSAASGKDGAQENLVRNFVTKASACELKWIAKVLLRELHASVTQELVFSAYHPDASDLYKVDSRLREVVDQCRDRSKRLGEACIEVNKAFKPMLAEKTQDLDKITKNFKNKPFWIEPKVRLFFLLQV